MKKSLFRFAFPPAPMLALICIFLCAALPAPALGASFLDRVIDRASDAALDKADEAVKNYLEHFNF